MFTNDDSMSPRREVPTPRHTRPTAARRTPRTRAALAAALLMLFACVGSAAGKLPRLRPSDDLPRGRVVEGVRVEGSQGQTYALYLPSAYTPEKKWPVIYAFDPSGQGKFPVGLFRAAAERFGYVVVGSNDSRNGLQPAVVMQIITALWKDTHARLSLDDARVYATGFSGGARVANRLAVLCKGCVAGVISCGAGFPPDIAPTATLPYAFFGTVGVDDFNFREMRPLERTLDSLGVTSRLATFDGRHQWCPEEICTEGVEWMELLAMKTGRRAKDDALIDAALARMTAKAETFKRPEDAYERYVALRTVATTFDGLRDVSKFRGEADALKDSKEFRAAVAEESRQIADEQTHAKEIIAIGDGLTDGETHDESLARIRRLLEPLRERAKRDEDSPERRVARRTLAHVLAETYESALYIYEPQKKYALAVVNLEVAATVVPAAAQIEFELARALALDGRKGGALDALSRAFEKGYRDAPSVERDEAFTALRSESKYKKLLERMRQEPAGEPGEKEKARGEE